MDKKDFKKLAFLLLALLLIAGVIDIKTLLSPSDVLLRGELGSGDEEVELKFEVEGASEEWAYELEIKERLPTPEEAEGYFAKAILEVEADFEGLGDSISSAEKIPLKDKYCGGKVSARWNIKPRQLIDALGNVNWEKAEALDTTLIQATVSLHCGTYESSYSFGFHLPKRSLSRKEVLEKALEEWWELEMAKEGSSEIKLPKELAGIAVKWKSNRKLLTGRVLLFGVGVCIILKLLQRRITQEKERKALRQIELFYPQLMEQIMLLLGAGMTLRQVWNKIATRYSAKREKDKMGENPVCEAIVRLNCRLREGEIEKVAYQKFAQEFSNPSYQRLMRLLIGSLEKGAGGLRESLSLESRQAKEQRMKQVKIQAEEAGTKLIIPLLLMLLVVMAISVAPALLEFTT